MTCRCVMKCSVLLAFALSIFVGLTSPSARAQELSPNEIVRKLMPAPQTRSLRGVSVTSGEEPKRPTVRLYVNFEFDSAKLETDGLLTLKRLGTALQDPKLAGYRFDIAGHTDSVGTPEYNQELSEKRAKAVRDHLIFYYSIAPERLNAVGYGKSHPLDPSKPEDSSNRRVEVTNVGP